MAGSQSGVDGFGRFSELHAVILIPGMTLLTLLRKDIGQKDHSARLKLGYG
jgi:hypothetical protein